MNLTFPALAQTAGSKLVCSRPFHLNYQIVYQSLLSWLPNVIADLATQYADDWVSRLNRRSLYFVRCYPVVQLAVQFHVGKGVFFLICCFN